ncbi:DUF1304 family protein [Kingella kingae]|nr:DUF1304 family protein [Kingella kingae]MBD3632760.1 DUF1304 family protein [Kingella kingae]MBD3660117.1 DUF1304 family protein [Kingella kingae]QIF42380.1 DUF1304 family protein [Kingella kingae]
MKLQRYGVANALMCYLHTAGVVALSRFYFISLHKDWIMLILATLFGLLAAAIHGYIFYLEVVAFGSDAFRRIFRTQLEVEPMLRPTFNNLGIYNLGLGVMTLLGLLGCWCATSARGEGLALGLACGGLGMMLWAGTYLWLTSPDKRKAALIQGLPTLLALLALGLQ